MRTSDPKELTKSLIKKINQISQTDVLVGIPKEATEKKDGETFYLADIAFVQNYGSYSKENESKKEVSVYTKQKDRKKGKIPPRPFGTTTVPRYKEKIFKFFGQEVDKALSGKQTVKKAFDRIGMVVSGYMRKNLHDGEWTPNAQSTIDKKGSDKPLIDKGGMSQAITWVTRTKKKK